MRGLQSLTLLLALFLSVVSAITTDELIKLTTKGDDQIIQLNDLNHETLLGTPRDDYILVLLTATSPNVKCAVCIDFDGEFKTIVSSWFKDHPDGKSLKGNMDSLFFARANVKDTKNIPNVFKFYKVENVPRLFLFAPNGDIHTYQNLPIGMSTGIHRIKTVVAQLQNATSISDFTYYKPVNYTSLAFTCISVFVTVFILKKYRSVVYKVLTQKLIWGIATVGFIILMLSGYMFNAIKKVRYAGVDNEGDIIYFLPGQMQSQFAVETQIMFVLYALLALSVSTLVVGMPSIKKFLKGEKNSKMIINAIPIVLSGAVLVLAISLSSIYRIKQTSYPF